MSVAGYPQSAATGGGGQAVAATAQRVVVTLGREERGPAQTRPDPSCCPLGVQLDIQWTSICGIDRYARQLLVAMTWQRSPALVAGGRTSGFGRSPPGHPAVRIGDAAGCGVPSASLALHHREEHERTG